MDTSIIDELKRETSEIGAFHKGADLHTKPTITVCVDFDGTMVEHEYPYIGKEATGCVDILHKWINEYNVGIILDTMRSGKYLDEAVKWCYDHDIKLYGIGEDPHQKEWTQSPKAYAPFSVDDRNIGCPLIVGKSRRPYVDWKTVNLIFEPLLKKLTGK